MMTLALWTLDGPKSLEAFRNCCHQEEDPVPLSGPVVPGLEEIEEMAEPLVTGEAAVVPQAAMRATANTAAAPVTLGRTGRDARG
jgi:hypothetical protein